jgi:hypothetical protein
MGLNTREFSKPGLLARYVGGGELLPNEVNYLREVTTRAELEALATGPAGRNGGSRRLYKQWNILFATKAGPKKPPPSAPHPVGMFKTIRAAKAGHGGEKIATGGGANGTGRRR